MPTLVPLFWRYRSAPETDGAAMSWDVAVSLSAVPPGSLALWPSLLAAYFVTGVTLAALRRQYKEIAALRLATLSAAAPPPEAYAVLCLDIPLLPAADAASTSAADPSTAA